MCWFPLTPSLRISAREICTSSFFCAASDFSRRSLAAGSTSARTAVGARKRRTRRTAGLYDELKHIISLYLQRPEGPPFGEPSGRDAASDWPASDAGVANDPEQRTDVLTASKCRR